MAQYRELADEDLRYKNPQSRSVSPGLIDRANDPALQTFQNGSGRVSPRVRQPASGTSSSANQAISPLQPNLQPFTTPTDSPLPPTPSTDVPVDTLADAPVDTPEDTLADAPAATPEDIPVPVAAPAPDKPAPFVPTERAPQTPTFVQREPTETGAGTAYTGMSQEQILEASQQGLISMLDRDNALMQLARKSGARQAEARGLGGSSLRERAAEGAAIESAMPLVMQAGQLASAERQNAQQLTANSEIQASNRRLSEMQQQYELAVQSGDTAAARQLQSDMASESNNLAQWQTQSDIYSRELLQQRDIELRTKIAEDDRILQRDMQNIDIDYKQWLEDVTFQHQGILQGNAQAASSYSDFTQAAMNILNNPDTSSAQKTAALDALKEALGSSLTLIGATANIDLSKFLPEVKKTEPPVNPIDRKFAI